MPLALINEGYLWLGNQPGLLFMALSIYFFESKEKTRSMIALGISAMFRQEFILLALPFLVVEFRSGWTCVGRRFAELSAVVLLVSVPFLILAPSSYLSAISYGLVNLAQKAPAAATSLSSQGLHFLQSCSTSVPSGQY